MCVITRLCILGARVDKTIVTFVLQPIELTYLSKDHMSE